MGIAFSKAELLAAVGEAGLHPLAWLPMLLVLADSVVFLWVGTKWIGRNIFGRRGSPAVSAGTHPVIAASLVTLVVLTLISAYLAYPLVKMIGFYGGV
jgi:hydrogenase-4 component D